MASGQIRVVIIEVKCTDNSQNSCLNFFTLSISSICNRWKPLVKPLCECWQSIMIANKAEI